ncbi:MAG: hypothetical protein A3J54_01005 [Candidatus Ryanbacteria bacterium RIFCSPHIGHO2_02_FULL_45_13b]|uniref:GTPase Obg n=1 Tax=Candidatus Ryanbacteria bacterium RIFCSPHIGHO2_02_FULL_45_13b TaxID=1802117 RepID=A0A1G2G926_9BACT|nr:MAG: hypothetical protein A3J54_01005 [Candidatus Ryanbacteria bacterium RIFCSPHIGHO2_02_FULL_45_13b]
MLIDEITITVTSGKGGRGGVAFSTIKMSLGPTGGNGGKGGSVYVEGISDLGALSQFRYKKDIEAKNGADGKAQFSDGPDAPDVILRIPVGTVIRVIETQETKELLKIGERILIAKGGRGGKGNYKFRSPKNTTPREFQPGLSGEHFTLKLELKLIADVGLIGLPNAGKSSLLNELTEAKSKVANYAFTTLEPHLGVYYDLILADIPGIIEGASDGKGLGAKFLRHIERTKILFHLISAESADPVRDYKIIRNELSSYSKNLAEKTEYVFLSKSDVVPITEITKKITALKKVSKNIFGLSIHDEQSLEKVKNILNKIIDEK